MLNNYETKDDCKPCKRKQPATVKKGNVGLFTGILLALLPKCPFCLMAYSSTVMLCGKTGTLVSKLYFTSSVSILITVLFCLMALSGIIFNYRDHRTKYAIGLVAAGSVFIIVSVSATGGLSLYYSGVFLVFIGVWLNSSLMYFVKKIKNKMGNNYSHDFNMIREN